MSFHACEFKKRFNSSKLLVNIMLMTVWGKLNNSVKGCSFGLQISLTQLHLCIHDSGSDANARLSTRQQNIMHVPDLRQQPSLRET